MGHVAGQVILWGAHLVNVYVSTLANCGTFIEEKWTLPTVLIAQVIGLCVSQYTIYRMVQNGFFDEKSTKDGVKRKGKVELRGQTCYCGMGREEKHSGEHLSHSGWETQYLFPERISAYSVFCNL